MSHPKARCLNPYYFAGRKAREAGAAKVPPSYYAWCSRHWWLAGWNDRDLELAGALNANQQSA